MCAWYDNITNIISYKLSQLAQYLDCHVSVPVTVTLGLKQYQQYYSNIHNNKHDGLLCTCITCNK